MVVDDRSFTTGLSNDKSDIDICIYNANPQSQSHTLSVEQVAKFLEKHKMENVFAITEAKVPIVKFVDPTTRIACDMNIQHTLGIHNSVLVKAYLDIDERLVQFLVLLKHFARSHGILDASLGYLSSYAYNLMGIVFFQQQKEAILPRLQSKDTRPRSYDQQGKSRKRMVDFGSCLDNGTIKRMQVSESGTIYDCSYDTRTEAYRSYGFLNKKTVAQLLFEFFEYFSRRFDYRTMEVSAMNGCIQERHYWQTQKQQQTQPTASSSTLAVTEVPTSTTTSEATTATATGATSPSSSSSSYKATYVFDPKRKLWLSAAEQAFFKDLDDHGGIPSGEVPIPGVTSASALILSSTSTSTSTSTSPARPVAIPRGSYQDKFGSEVYLCVMDPFIYTRNVAATCRGERLVKVWKCFDYAYKCLGQGKFVEAFQPLDSNDKK